MRLLKKKLNRQRKQGSDQRRSNRRKLKLKKNWQKPLLTRIVKLKSKNYKKSI